VPFFAESNMLPRFMKHASLILGVAAVAACSDSSAPGVAGRQVALQLATRPATTAPSAGANLVGTETITLGSDVIEVTQVQLVLEQIELQRAGGSVCDATLPQDDCEELKAGPVLLDLPLGAGASRQFTVAIDTGTYGKVEFKIHKPESSNDAAFIAANPAFDGVSIRMTGTWNGTPFTYTTDLDVEQEADLIPPLSVTDAAGAQFTLLVNLSEWFANQANTGLIDPSTANPGGQFEGEVKSNIETSFHAFEDENHDGQDDHGST
jgi:hypothetical protein